MLKLVAATLASLMLSVPVYAGSAGSANPNAYPSTPPAASTAPSPAYGGGYSSVVIELPIAISPEDASPDETESDWQPPDEGPQYSDNSLGSIFREQAARDDQTADDIAGAREDVAQAREDGDDDATMMQASGVAKMVEAGADATMAVTSKLAGPEGESVTTLYGQAKGLVNAAFGEDGEGAIETGKAIGETIGSESTANRYVNGIAAANDLDKGEYWKAGGEAATAAGYPTVGALAGAVGTYNSGVERYHAGAEQRESIDSQAEAADERMSEQEDAVRSRADELRATANAVDEAPAENGDSASADTDDGD
jgi:hypothetical protein